jgi:hypothetical protein
MNFNFPNNCCIFSVKNEVIKPTIEGMVGILKSCKEAGTVKRVVFTSSAGTVNVEEHRKPVYDETCWSDVDFCRRVKMTGWVCICFFLSSSPGMAWKKSSTSKEKSYGIYWRLIFKPL